ncbi:hypothetical protein ACIVBQ_000486 [Tenacibaculum discolor]
MSRKIDFKNNFKMFEQDFRNDTGLNMRDNMEAYIQYANFRFSDRTWQMTWHMMNELINLPKDVAFHINMNGK